MISEVLWDWGKRDGRTGNTAETTGRTQQRERTPQGKNTAALVTGLSEPCWRGTYRTAARRTRRAVLTRLLPEHPIRSHQVPSQPQAHSLRSEQPTSPAPPVQGGPPNSPHRCLPALFINYIGCSRTPGLSPRCPFLTLA